MRSNAPFLTVGLGWLWLGVKESWTTLAASLVALFGATITVGGRWASLRLEFSLSAMAIMMLIIRQHHETPMLPAALCPLPVWPFAARRSMSAPSICSSCSCSATTQFGLGLVFLTVGGQMVSATENALINTLETPLAAAFGVGLLR